MNCCPKVLTTRAPQKNTQLQESNSNPSIVMDAEDSCKDNFKYMLSKTFNIWSITTGQHCV